MRLIYILPAALFLVLATYFALALRPGYDPHTLPSALLNKPAPVFDLVGFSGQEGFKSQKIHGQVAVVNFFASWCVPCRVEQPILMRLSEQEHVPLYGIAYKDRPADAAEFLAQLGNPYRLVGLDENGFTGINFGVYGVPETYVIDKTGVIRKRFVGPLTAEAINNELLPLLHKLSKQS